MELYHFFFLSFVHIDNFKAQMFGTGNLLGLNSPGWEKGSSYNFF